MLLFCKAELTQSIRNDTCGIDLGFEKGRYKATWKREFKLPWREAGPPNHLDEKVDVDQSVVNKELSLGLWDGPCRVCRARPTSERLLSAPPVSLSSTTAVPHPHSDQVKHVYNQIVSNELSIKFQSKLSRKFECGQAGDTSRSAPYRVGDTPGSRALLLRGRAIFFYAALLSLCPLAIGRSCRECLKIIDFDMPPNRKICPRLAG